MSDKIYAVTDGVSGNETLVRAAGLQTAIAHVAARQFTGRLLKGGEVFDRIEAGAKVETAKQEAQGATPAPEAARSPNGAQGGASTGGGKNGQ